MFTIKQLATLEILDSRGRPTLKTRCRLASGAEAAASVPSGASTGTRRRSNCAMAIPVATEASVCGRRSQR
jgi:enolase